MKTLKCTQFCLAMLFVLGNAALNTTSAFSADLSARQVLENASEEGKYTYLLFYRNNDQRTRMMESETSQHVKNHADRTQFKKVHVYDRGESDVVNQFDAKRIPVPAVIAVAPNGAITCIHNRSISQQQLERSLLTTKYAEVVLALQNDKIAVVSLLPTDDSKPTKAARQFLKSDDFSDRSVHIQVSAEDESERDFYARVKVDPETEQSQVILFAPPGRHLGTFDNDVTLETLTEKVHASGSCNCEKCKHNHN
ncbi:hypothetical protein [Rubinisphaera sp.]|uniref:hypothetical protein n=1 Tax=Rubinisphaera sp. TaxID=2024857 RepID=UPI000C10272B|nr:hypothetical protein [Rubinisphaera sp.]MBV09974.1 hypothetical protein [Rubinisphaera sp.]HCS54640.1 hypothetical protein [Planctomycetaceae bacterium]|tara:strand:- start:4032 stop:4790 length:759 start_codon:yes stop_codon:yes gene_type:complete